MSEYSTLLRQIMEARGLTQSALAGQIGVSQGTVSRWLSGGKVEVDNREAIERLAGEVLHVHPRHGGRRKVPVVGYAAAGSDELHFDAEQATLDEVDAPEWANDNTVAIIVRGSSLGRFLDGWTAFYDDRRNPPDDSVVGHICVVEVKGNGAFIKRLRNGSRKGLYHLESATEGTMFDQEVAWAAKVLLLRPD